MHCNDCKRVYTPYTQKGIVYYGAHCKKGCTNSHKSFNISQMVDFIGSMMFELCFTESELAEINTKAGSNEIALLEEQRLKQTEIHERKKKKIKEDLGYLQTNKLNLLKTGVYSPEAIIEEENNLKNGLIQLQNEEVASGVSMAEVINNTIKLSELLKTLHLYYENANHTEKDTIIRFVFSELNIFQTTLIYKCENGFQALKSRFFTPCGGGEIRTHEELSPLTVFKTVPFNHSGTPPSQCFVGASSCPLGPFPLTCSHYSHS